MPLHRYWNKYDYMSLYYISSYFVWILSERNISHLNCSYVIIEALSTDIFYKIICHAIKKKPLIKIKN